MKLQYENYDSDYNLMGVSWNNDNQKISINYTFGITAIFSKPLKKVIIEAFQEGELHFYNLDGTFAYKKIYQNCRHIILEV